MRQAIFLAFLATACLAGCPGKGSGVDDFTGELRSLVEEVSNRVEADPSVAGVTGAAKFYASEKPGLQKKFDQLIAAKPDEATKNELMSKVVDNLSLLRGLKSKFLAEVHQDPVFSNALNGLISDFETTFNPQQIR